MWQFLIPWTGVHIIPDTRFPCQQKFVWRHLIFVNPQYVTLPIPRILTWLLEFCKIVHPWIFNKILIQWHFFIFIHMKSFLCQHTCVMSCKTEKHVTIHTLWQQCVNSDNTVLRHPIQYLYQLNITFHYTNRRDRSANWLSSAIHKHHSHWCGIAKYCVLVLFSKYVRMLLHQTAEQNNININDNYAMYHV